MRISYSPEHRIAYIQLLDSDAEVTTKEVTEDVLVDIDENGQVVGIELLRPPADLWKKIELENVETGALKRII